MFFKQWEFRGTGPKYIFIWKFCMIALWIGRQALNIKTQGLNSSTPALSRARTSKLTRSVSVPLIQKSEKGQFPNRKGQSIVQYMISVWLRRCRRKSLGIIYHYTRFHQPWRSKCFEICFSDSPPLIFEKAHLVKSQLESC